MENASKALLIAAAVLIVILIITFGIRIFNSTSDTQQSAIKTGETISDKIQLAKESAEKAAGNLYADWNADFYIHFDGVAAEDGVLDLTDSYLIGNYDPFGWIAIPLDNVGFDIKEGVVYPALGSVMEDWFTYEAICGSVKDFTCGIYLSDAVLAANPDLSVTVDLVLAPHTIKAGETAVESLTIGSYTYDIDDLADPVAKIGDEEYATLARAVAAANDGDIITMVANHNVTAPVVIEKDVTIDLNGKTITTADDVTIYPIIRIQGGADVTIENGSIINKNDYTFVLGASDSSSAGNLTIKSGTYYGQTTLASVTKGKLVVEGGNFSIMPYYDPTYGDFNYNCMFNCYDPSYSAGEAAIEIKGGSFKNFNPADNAAEGMNTNFLAEGYKVVKTNAVTYTVEGIYVAEVNGVKYITLAGAVAAAENGGTVTLLNNATGAGVVIDKDITIDFAGYTYSFNKGVGSTGTTTNGFQILEGNTVVLKDGTLNVAEEAKDEFYILVQNYANLTVQDMTLDGTNLDKYSGTDGDSYTLSNNSGTVAITGATNIIANDEGYLAYAFDVCKFGNYDAPVVTVDTTGTITGNIEVTGGIDDNLQISNGTYTMDVTQWCDDGLAANYDEFAGMYIVGDAPGTENNPIELYWYWNDEQTMAWAYPGSIPAGETMYCITTMGGVELTVDGVSYGMLNGNWFVPASVEITNDGTEEIWPELVIAYPAGSWSNPAELVIGSNTATIVEGNNQGYLFNWTATHNGVLTITMPDSDWQYNVDNLTSYAYGDKQTSADGLKTYTVTVTKGDEIQVNVSTFNPQNPYGDAPVGTVTFTAAFEKEAVAVIGDERYATVKEALEAASKVASKSNPVTVELIANSDETGSALTIAPYVTLNLGVYELKAGFVTGLKGSFMTAAYDTYGNEGKNGKLVIEKDNISLSSAGPNGTATDSTSTSGYKVIPIWLDDHYVFVQAATRSESFVRDLTAGTATTEFNVNFTYYVRQLMKTYGTSKYGASIVIRVSWTEEQESGDIAVSQEYVYSDKLVASAFTNSNKLKAVTAECDDESKKDLYFTIAVVTDAGVELSSQNYYYATTTES